MPFKLLFVSFGTLSALFGAVVMVLSAALVAGGAHPAVLIGVIFLTVVMGFVGWAFGPFVMDLMQGWVYSIEKLSFDEFERRHPEVGAFIRQTCQSQGLPLPMMRIVQDDNPTAYTYGSLPSNARVVLSRGLFRYLDTDEVCAVAAHELGHVRHYDFLVMTLATTLLQVLYEIYWVLTRRSSGNRKGAGPLIGLGAYVLWFVGTYAVLYLSRTREYMADAFAAKIMGDAAPLQRALVRIAYGMVEVQMAGTGNVRLLEATRAMGIYDAKAATSVGTAVQGNLAVKAQTGGKGFDVAAMSPIFLFDLFNPWAKVTELSSTHPLTGKRIRALDEQAPQFGKRPLFNFQAIDQEGNKLDYTRLYGKFFFEVTLYFLPWMLPVPVLLAAIFFPPLLGSVVLAFAVGLFIKSAYSYAVGSDFAPTTFYALMCDPYASPMRGRPVQLQGQIVGKALAGSKIGEDLTMQDRSGGLVALNYESLFWIFGNLFFGIGKARTAIGQTATATGWFRRSIYQFVDLSELRLGDGTEISSYTRFWGVGGSVLLMAIGVVIAAAGLVAGF